MLTVAYDESVKGPVDFQPDYIMLDVLYQNIHKYRGKKLNQVSDYLQIWVKEIS